MIEETQSFNSHLKDNCHHCDQKSLLIQKYEKLIKLLRKKERQNNSEVSSKISHGKTSTHTSEATSSSSSSSRFFYTLQALVLKRQSFFFYLLDRKPTKKFLIVFLANKIKKHALQKGFRKIFNFCSTQKLNKLKHLDQRLCKCTKDAFQHLKQAGGGQVKAIREYEEENGKKVGFNGIINNFKKIECELKNMPNKPNYNIKELSRRNIQLSMKNCRLEKENQHLKDLLDDCVRRQNKENQKKKESLEMLAEELFEKNQLIQQLQNTIRTYENKCNNVLEDDVVALRNETEHLQSVKDKLHHQLSKIVKKLQDLEGKQGPLCEALQNCEKQNVSLRQRLFDLEVKDIQRSNLSTSLSSLMKAFDSKIKELKVYEKQYRNLRNGIQTKCNPSLEAINEQSKAQVILCFLENISVLDFQMPTFLFDEEELQLLMNHQKNYRKLMEPRIDNKAKTLAHEFEGRQIEDEIEFKGKIGDESIFGVAKEQQKGKANIRLLEMQLQKNKQIERISELKDKLMHIRMIILNLLKSLQIKNTSQDCQGIVRILFDLFQYSEEEREQVFAPKRKKFFGFI